MSVRAREQADHTKAEYRPNDQRPRQQVDELENRARDRKREFVKLDDSDLGVAWAVFAWGGPWELWVRDAVGSKWAAKDGEATTLEGLRELYAGRAS